MSTIESLSSVEDLSDPIDAGIDDEETLTAETLIEEISIDGMCGVY